MGTPTTCSASITASMRAQYGFSADPTASNNTGGASSKALAFKLGTSDEPGKGTICWSAAKIAAANTPDNIDLSGALTNPDGAIVSFAKVRAILIEITSKDAADTGQQLTIGNGATPFLGPFGAAAHTVKIGLNDLFLITNWEDGWDVTNATADILKLTPGSVATPYQIMMIGDGVTA